MNSYRLQAFAMIVGLSLCSGIVSAQPTPSRVTPRNDLSVMARDPFKVFDNLYFVGIGEVASYVLTTSDGHILIDTLWDLPGYTEYLLGNIRKMGLDPADIKYVLILQGHRDHYAKSDQAQHANDRGDADRHGAGVHPDPGLAGLEPGSHSRRLVLHHDQRFP